MRCSISKGEKSFSVFCSVYRVLLFSVNLLLVVSALLLHVLQRGQKFLKISWGCGTLKRLGNTGLKQISYNKITLFVLFTKVNC